MNVRILRVHAIECVCEHTRPRFILSSESVFWWMESEPTLTQREKSPLPEAYGKVEPATLHHAEQRAQLTIDWAIPAPHWSDKARRLAGQPVEHPCSRDWYHSAWETLGPECSLVVCWARCPAWFFSGRGDVSLGVYVGSDSIPRKLFRRRA